MILSLVTRSTFYEFVCALVNCFNKNVTSKYIFDKSVFALLFKEFHIGSNYIFNPLD